MNYCSTINTLQVKIWKIPSVNLEKLTKFECQVQNPDWLGSNLAIRPGINKINWEMNQKISKMLTEKLGIRETGEVWWCGRRGHDDVVKSRSTFVRLEDMIACTAWSCFIGANARFEGANACYRPLRPMRIFEGPPNGGTSFVSQPVWRTNMQLWKFREPSIFNILWDIFSCQKINSFSHVLDTSGICHRCPRGLSIGYIENVRRTKSQNPRKLEGWFPTRRQWGPGDSKLYTRKKIQEENVTSA